MPKKRLTSQFRECEKEKKERKKSIGESNTDLGFLFLLINQGIRPLDRRQIRGLGFLLLRVEKTIGALAVAIELGIGLLLRGFALNLRMDKIRRSSGLQFRLSALNLDIALQFGILGLCFTGRFDIGKLDTHVEVDLRGGELSVGLSLFALALGFQDGGGGVDLGDFLAGFATFFGFLLGMLLALRVDCTIVQSPR